MHSGIGTILLLIALVFSTGAFAFTEQINNTDKTGSILSIEASQSKTNYDSIKKSEHKSKYKSNSVLSLDTTYSKSIYDSIELVLYHYADNPCSIPGAIQISDDSCKHSLYKYIKPYSLSDTLIRSSDSTQTLSIKARTTLQTFLRFSEIPSSSPRLSKLKHDQFLKLVETKNEVRKMPWIIKKFFAVWYFVFEVIGKIIEVIINPVMKLSPLWKVVLVLIIALLVTCIIIIVSRFSARFYPSSFDNKVKAKLLPDTQDSNWLSSAQSHLNQRMYAECISDLYRWLLQSIDSRKMVRRYEWWTNRQLLELIRVRSKKQYPLAGSIISLYEQTIYGHRVPQSETVEQLMQSVINDKGLRS